jgi:hypothetical protein
VGMCVVIDAMTIDSIESAVEVPKWFSSI